MSSSVGARIARGKVEGTTSEIKIGLEFAPRKVELFNVDGLVKGVWTETMAPGEVMKTITDGTITFESSGGITQVEQQELDDKADPGRGFTIGTDANLNASGEDIHWVAYE